MINELFALFLEPFYADIEHKGVRTTTHVEADNDGNLWLSGTQTQVGQKSQSVCVKLTCEIHSYEEMEAALKEAH